MKRPYGSGKFGRRDKKGKIGDQRAVFKQIHSGSKAAEFGPKDDTLDAKTLPGKKKCALIVSYVGTNYQGLQINPGANTIEAELELALYKNGGIAEANFGNIQKIQWTRAARTDKGVSACIQVCSGKICYDDTSEATTKAFVEGVNSHLPSDIRLMDLVRVTKGFNAKNNCTKRRYQYYLPTYCLAPAEYIKSVFESVKQNMDKEGKESKESTKANAPSSSPSTEYFDKVRQELSSYRMDGVQYGELLSLLPLFEGTHSYHNYSNRATPGENTALRFIMEFKCSRPHLIHACSSSSSNCGSKSCTSSNKTGSSCSSSGGGDGGSGGGEGTSFSLSPSSSPSSPSSCFCSEWLVFTVVGQSFMLHQIRKMVGVVCEVIRGASPNLTHQSLGSTFETGYPKGYQYQQQQQQYQYQKYKRNQQQHIQQQQEQEQQQEQQCDDRKSSCSNANAGADADGKDGGQANDGDGSNNSSSSNNDNSSNNGNSNSPLSPSPPLPPLPPPPPPTSYVGLCMNLPIVPGLGLILDRPYFEVYNQKHAKEKNQLSWPEDDGNGNGNGNGNGEDEGEKEEGGDKKGEDEGEKEEGGDKKGEDKGEKEDGGGVFGRMLLFKRERIAKEILRQERNAVSKALTNANTNVHGAAAAAGAAAGATTITAATTVTGEAGTELKARQDGTDSGGGSGSGSGSGTGGKETESVLLVDGEGGEDDGEVDVAGGCEVEVEVEVEGFPFPFIRWLYLMTEYPLTYEHFPYVDKRRRKTPNQPTNQPTK